jgi:hypothetical protein
MPLLSLNTRFSLSLESKTKLTERYLDQIFQYKIENNTAPSSYPLSTKVK